MAANVARDGGRGNTRRGVAPRPKPKKAPINVTPKTAPVAKMKAPISSGGPTRKTPQPIGQMRQTSAKMQPKTAARFSPGQTQGAMRAPSSGGYSGGQIDTNATGQYSGTMGSFGMDAGMPQEVAAPEPPQKRLADLTQEEKDAIYNSDTQFTGESSALEQARLALMADLDNQESEYNRGYTRNLSDIGWLGEGQGTNGWDQDNLQTAYGSSYHGDLNDFAGRGMLNSTAYLQALSRMNDDFKNQVGELGASKNAFMTDTAAQRSTGQNTYNANLDEARRQALYRAALSNGWAV